MTAARPLAVALLAALLARPSLGGRGGAVPSPLQLAWHGRSGAIIHYNMATDALSTGRSCGRGDWPLAADPRTFGRALDACPDTDAWLDAVVAGGMDYAILVAKHNCGFVTWPTAVTLPDGRAYGYGIANSSAPAGCDVISRFVASCAARGVRAAFYYSFMTNMYLNVEGGAVSNETLMPGQELVTQREFFDIALGHLGELWAKAPLLEIWADGGIPADPYLNARVRDLHARLQPGAAVYNGFPTFNDSAVRWIGVGGGPAPDPTWSTGSCEMGNGGHGPLPHGGDPDSPDWCPAEVDSTLQGGEVWWWHPPAGLNSLPALVETFHASRGRNSNWVLGLSPAPNGTIAPTHAAMLAQLGTWLRGCYGAAPAAAGAMAAGATTLTVAPAGGGAARVDRVRLREDQAQGQRVRAYNVTAALAGGGSVLVANGTSVGAGKIDRFAQAVQATSLTLVTDDAPLGLTLEAFYCEDPAE